MIPPRDAYVLARLLVGHALNGELQAVSEPFRRLADHLDGLPHEARQTALDGYLCGRADHEDVIRAIASADPEGPPPEADADGGGEERADGWPPLRLRQPPPSPPFPVEVFPVPLQAYCREVAAATLAPIDFVGGAVLAVASAVPEVTL